MHTWSHDSLFVPRVVATFGLALCESRSQLIGFQVTSSVLATRELVNSIPTSLRYGKWKYLLAGRREHC